jgi:hypothetical protein
MRSTEWRDEMKSCARPNSPRETNVWAQPFPQTGLLARHLNQSLVSLGARIGSKLLERPLYSYIVTSAKLVDGELWQTGSAPNFQGGVVTLCTCKHKDRSSPPPKSCRGPNAEDPWQGVWVAGLCSSTQVRPRGLFYLMLVETTCGSHAAAWKTLKSPMAKSAHRDRFGDVYEPRQTPSSQPWRESSYKSHLRDHVHDAKGRAYDIERGFHGRHPRLLIGDPRHSYLWSKALITLQEPADTDWASAHHRFYPRIADFLSLCE